VVAVASGGLYVNHLHLTPINHDSTSSLNSLQAECSSGHLTVSEHSRHFFTRALKLLQFKNCVDCSDNVSNCTNRISTHTVKYSHELCENVAEPINMQFGMLSQVGPWNRYYMGI